MYQLAYTVDGSGKVTQSDVTDPRGFVRRVTFNAEGYALSETFALGRPEQQTSTYQRQAGTNFVTSMTDALGRATSMTHDAQGNLTSVTRLSGTPGAATASMTYELNLYAYTANSPTNFTDPSGLSVGGVRGRMSGIAQRKLNADYILGWSANFSAGFGDRFGDMLVPDYLRPFVGDWNPNPPF